MKGKETLSLVNIKNLHFENNQSLNKSEVNKIKNQDLKIDGVEGFESWGFGLNKTEREIVVFEPEQIHILGSKQDIEGFENFIKTDEQKRKCLF